jgi:tripartite-type tricarboxylate transporter receptor subunit TctC
VANVSVMSVNADEPYQDFGQLLQAFKDKPGQIPVATAGQLSAGHNSMIAIQKYTGIEYKHVTYDGGNPAVIATVAGECVAVPQLAVEQADMLAGGRLRALAVLDDKPLELEKYGSIPPITKWVPDFVPGPNYFGIWIPKDAPQEVIDTFGQLWDDVMENSEALKKYAASRGAVFDPSWGAEAKKKAMPYLSIIAWNLHEAGETVMSPSEVGIPRP